MTDHQIYIAAAIPFFFATLLWLALTLSNRSAIAAMDKRFDDESETLNKRITAIADSVNKRIEDLREDLRSEMRAGLSALDRRLNDTNQRIGRLEARFDKSDDDLHTTHSERLSTLEARLADRAT